MEQSREAVPELLRVPDRLVHSLRDVEFLNPFHLDMDSRDPHNVRSCPIADGLSRFRLYAVTVQNLDELQPVLFAVDFFPFLPSRAVRAVRAPFLKSFIFIKKYPYFCPIFALNIF